MNLKQLTKSKTVKNTGIIAGVGLLMLAYSHGVLAADDSETVTLGTLASNIRGTFTHIAELMIGIAYISGIGFFIAAIFKFKQHKDNPTQIPMGTPVALLMIAISLVFLPYIITASGATFTGGGGEDKNYSGGVTGDKSMQGLPGWKDASE